MKHRKYGTKYSWVTNPYQNICYDQHKPVQYLELCPIRIKDNYSLSENTLSQTNIISKGFFQT